MEIIILKLSIYTQFQRIKFNPLHDSTLNQPFARRKAQFEGKSFRTRVKGGGDRLSYTVDYKS